MLSLLLVVLAAVIILLIKMIRIQKHYRKLLMGNKEIGLEELLLNYREALDKLKREQERLKTSTRKMEYLLGNSIMGVGLKRYNAFKDTGSDLSFSLALLSKQNKGVVLTSLFGREETRVYAKDIEEGKSNYNLSEEELRAVYEAQQMMKQLEKPGGEK